MAVFLKRHNTLDKQLEHINGNIEEASRKIEEYNQNKEIKKDSLKWGIIVGIILFFIFPIGFLLGYFIRREILLAKYTSKLREFIRKLNLELDPIEKGAAGEKRVIETLEKLPHNFVVLNDIEIPSGNRTTQIDHIVICPNGNILCIETKNKKGKFYPKGKQWIWYPITGYAKQGQFIDSPQEQSKKQATALRDFLNARNLRPQVEPIVCMTNKQSAFMGKTWQCPVIFHSQLQWYIEKNFSKQSVPTEELIRIGNTILSKSISRNHLKDYDKPVNQEVEVSKHFYKHIYLAFTIPAVIIIGWFMHVL